MRVVGGAAFRSRVGPRNRAAVKIDVQSREAQLILDQLGEHLKGGLMLRLMDPLEAQVIIGFCKKLRRVADHRPPRQIEVTVEVVRDPKN